MMPCRMLELTAQSKARGVCLSSKGCVQGCLTMDVEFPDFLLRCATSPCHTE